MYNWEAGGNHIRKRKVKKSGTVMFHTDPTPETDFDKLLKEVPLSRVLPSSTAVVESKHEQRKPVAPKDVDDEPKFIGYEGTTAVRDADTAKITLMTKETVNILTAPAGKKSGGFGFESLLPSQAQCYRGIFKGRDVILHSRTGSGKTLAYALPLIERFLLLDVAAPGNEESAAPSKKGSKKAAVSAESSAPTFQDRTPFMLIFVFSNELASQTKSVLDKLYAGRGLKVAVANSHTIRGTSDDEPALSSLSRVDVLIGTVPNMDIAIRGTNAPLSTRPGQKRVRKEESESETDSDELNEESSDEDADSDVKKPIAAGPSAPLVSVARVKAIVVDEVDTTLGPRFSQIGKRMKALLSAVRRSNGSLDPSRLMKDFRAHHYVLCGATIPNWVIKAGFLGEKKYFYQLVDVGSKKLPAQLECYLLESTYKAPPRVMKPRVEKPKTDNEDDEKEESEVTPKELAPPVVARLEQLREAISRGSPLDESGNLVPNVAPKGWGRMVIFGNVQQLDALEEILNKSHADKKKSGFLGSVECICSLSPTKSEQDRIKAMSTFNTPSKIQAILLCTDTASRGLDFTNVDVVFMLGLPRHAGMAAETFVHRAGRTARANATSGVCVVIADFDRDRNSIAAIEATTHVSFKKLTMSLLPSTSSNGAPSKKSGEVTVQRTLTVKSPFSGSASNVAQGATGNAAEAILEKELKGKFDINVINHKNNENVDLYQALVLNLKKDDDNATTVTFETPVRYDHILTKKLWKYNLKTVA